MTRPIKFRAWDRDNKKMLVNTNLMYPALSPNGTLIAFRGDEKIPDTVAETRFTLMQYTGLHDKNGKEIYEGDILQSEYTNLGDDGPRCHPVVWGNGRWNVDHSITGCCKPWRGDLNGHHHSEVVIGNIYENPELIKQS